MRDSQRFAASQMAQLYCQRWEIELGFSEIKQSLQQGQNVLRSKQPELVMQEVWGVLIAHTLLRRWMRLMAQHAKVEPARISFHTARHAIVAAINTVHLRVQEHCPDTCKRCLNKPATSRSHRVVAGEASRARSSVRVASTPQRKCQSGLN